MDCLFCKIIKKEIPSKVIYEDDTVLAFLDLNQTNLGHTLIIPKEHIESIMNVSNETLLHMFEVSKKISKDLMDKLNQTGISYCINYGTTQDVKHLHLHLCPSSLPKTNDEVYEMLKKEA